MCYIHGYENLTKNEEDLSTKKREEPAWTMAIGYEKGKPKDLALNAANYNYGAAESPDQFHTIMELIKDTELAELLHEHQEVMSQDQQRRRGEQYATPELQLIAILCDFANNEPNPTLKMDLSTGVHRNRTFDNGALSWVIDKFEQWYFFDGKEGLRREEKRMSTVDKKEDYNFNPSLNELSHERYIEIIKGILKNAPA